eukprot:TRINITY_DN6363_c0_g1_i3.p1 TRINITY_DN6363_c0_g1~~TRINITY_DN6363_c0_g1_i3.p1  ORF type:complete len:124 (+),score=16.07 TRINITY_DN6363_c0_g1_i3:1-372(+)
MANKAAKRIKQTNSQTLQRLFLGTAVSLVVFLLLSWFNGSLFSAWLWPCVNLTAAGLALLQLSATAKAQEDVNLKGSFAQHMQDVVVVSWIGLIGTAISSLFNLIWLLALAYAAWLMFGLGGQ